MQTGSSKDDLLETLRRGDVAIFPTDTVYGIGCRIDFKQSVQRIYTVKNHGVNQPMPILLGDTSWVTRYVAEVPIEMQKLMTYFWPGPLTVVLPAIPNAVLPAFLNERGNASFRVPKDETVRWVIAELGVPIVGTSANFHGRPAPNHFQQIDSELKQMVSYVFDGPVEIGVESSVVELIDGNLMIHRATAISEEKIREAIGV